MKEWSMNVSIRNTTTWRWDVQPWDWRTGKTGKTEKESLMTRADWRWKYLKMSVKGTTFLFFSILRHLRTNLRGGFSFPLLRYWSNFNSIFSSKFPVIEICMDSLAINTHQQYKRQCKNQSDTRTTATTTEVEFQSYFPATRYAVSGSMSVFVAFFVALLTVLISLGLSLSSSSWQDISESMPSYSRLCGYVWPFSELHIGSYTFQLLYNTFSAHEQRKWLDIKCWSLCLSIQNFFMTILISFRRCNL